MKLGIFHKVFERPTLEESLEILDRLHEVVGSHKTAT